MTAAAPVDPVEDYRTPSSFPGTIGRHPGRRRRDQRRQRECPGHRPGDAQRERRWCRGRDRGGGRLGRLINVNSNTNASISGATITAGPASTDNVDVGATLVENTTGTAIAGQGGIVAVGAQVVIINDTSTQQAQIRCATINQAGGMVQVQATAQRNDSADEDALTVGGLVGGAGIGQVTLGGSTEATIAGGRVGQVQSVSQSRASPSAASRSTPAPTIRRRRMCRRVAVGIGGRLVQRRRDDDRSHRDGHRSATMPR